ncbi:MAG: MarC family NAAT transporter [Bacteroidota bacterium]
MLAFFFATLGAIFSVVNPLGALPIFLALTSDYTPKNRNATALQTAFWVAMIMVVFFLAGTYILNFFGISINALRIAGGLIIMNSGYGLLNGTFQERRVNADIEEEASNKNDISFTPMAMPMLSGPGSISLLIGMAAEYADYSDRLIIIGAVLAMAVIIWAILRYSTILFRILGVAGLKALSRIMGFLVMSIGIEILIRGVVSFVKTQL